MRQTEVSEMKVLRRIARNMRKDREQNENINGHDELST